MSGHHTWGHVVALDSMFPLWDPDGQRDWLTMWLSPHPPFPPLCRLSLFLTISPYSCRWADLIESRWLNLSSHPSFFWRFQLLIQVLKWNLFHLQCVGIHFHNGRSGYLHHLQHWQFAVLCLFWIVFVDAMSVDCKFMNKLFNLGHDFSAL